MSKDNKISLKIYCKPIKINIISHKITIFATYEIHNKTNI